MMEINKKSIRVWSMLGMRRIVGLMLKDLAEQDEKFLFTTADLGRYFGINDLAALYPEKIVDLGIAEQNLIGASAGLQNEGFHVWAATYATFITARTLDQIRVNIGLMNLGIKLIGAAGGLADGNFSATHMALEDFADLRAIPNIAIICPADGMELVKAMSALANYEGPAYLRLTGRANLPIVYREDYAFEIGKAVCLREGADIALIATGTLTATALKISGVLEKKGISCRVVDMHTIKPLDTRELERLSNYKMIVSLEEHMVSGGLGGAIAEYYTEKKIRPVHLIIGIRDQYPDACEYESLLERCGLTEEKLLQRIEKKYRELFIRST